LKNSYKPVVLALALGLAGCTPGPYAAAGAVAASAAAALSAPNIHDVPSEGPYFYRGTGVGSDATAGPFDVLLNKGFATAQWEGFGRNIFTHEYAWSASLRSMTHLNESMENSGGWGATLRTHVLAGSESGWKTWSWVPNYYGHVIEGGIAYRRLKEWAEAQGIGHAGLFAGLTTWTAAFINESYENPGGEPHGGTTLDLLFFDLGGILLFDTDLVSRFFAQKLGANVWPTQASILLNDGRLMNNGHHLVMKWGFPQISDRIAFFFKGGVGFAFGPAIRIGDGLDLNVGGGYESQIRFIDPVTRDERAEFKPAAGVWLDRRGVLLASVLFEPHTDRVLGLNVYPGVVPMMRGGGAWVNVLRGGHVAFGLTYKKAMGLGVGLGF